MVKNVSSNISGNLSISNSKSFIGHHPNFQYSNSMIKPEDLNSANKNEKVKLITNQIKDKLIKSLKSTISEEKNIINKLTDSSKKDLTYAIKTQAFNYNFNNSTAHKRGQS
jgi:hypothetical protein